MAKWFKRVSAQLGMVSHALVIQLSLASTQFTVYILVPVARIFVHNDIVRPIECLQKEVLVHPENFKFLTYN